MHDRRWTVHGGMPGVWPTEPKLGWVAGAADMRPTSVPFPFRALAGLSQALGRSNGMTQVSGYDGSAPLHSRLPIFSQQDLRIFDALLANHGR